MTKSLQSPTHSWAFRPRFRKDTFGWNGSKLAIGRIKEALSEIRAVARQDPITAADGAVILLEKISPALSGIDSSSGAIGSAVYAAVHQLAQLIGQAPASEQLRQKWLERLFEAYQDDRIPYIESIGDLWGELCVTPELASTWADRVLPGVHLMLAERAQGGYGFFGGTSVCYSALFKAGRHDELLQLLAQHPHPIWSYFVWGAKVLAARGQVDEAIAYVRAHAGSTTTTATIACFAEDLLLQAGRRAEAFEKFALLANQSSANLSTFRALAKKYPELSPEKLLSHLIACSPNEPGKWFATAKTLKLWDLAEQLAWSSPCDPLTLNRAARDHVSVNPAFAMQCALASLHWVSLGHGYELTGFDVIEPRRLALEAAAAVQQTELAQAAIDKTLSADRPMVAWMRRALGMAR